MKQNNSLPNPNPSTKKITDAMSPEEKDNLAIDNAMEKLDDEIHHMTPEEKSCFENKAGHKNPSESPITKPEKSIGKFE